MRQICAHFNETKIHRRKRQNLRQMKETVRDRNRLTWKNKDQGRQIDRDKQK